MRALEPMKCTQEYVCFVGLFACWEVTGHGEKSKCAEEYRQGE